MRTLAAITSLCSLGLVLSCDQAENSGPVSDCTTAGTCPVDGGSDGRPRDLPAAQDAISGVRDGSSESIATEVGFDRPPDGVAATGDGAGDGPGPGLDGGNPDAPGSSETVSDASTQESAPDVPGAQADASPSDAILNGTCAMNGGPAPAGTVCRASAGLCDIVEVCDGVSIACPFDGYKDAGQVCRPKAGDCDHEESCTGTSAACPADTFLSKGAVCRSAVSVCDVADTCSGASPTCPSDVVAPSTTQCRASTDGNICDPPEYCTGKSNQCPADAKYSPPATAPGGVLVTPGDLLADVAWNAVTGATGYNVKSSTIAGAGYSVRGSPASSPFTVTGITAGQPWYFVVSAYSGQPSCESADSSPPVSALSCVATAPTALVATPDAAGHVALTWTPPSGSVASYSVSRSTTSGSGYTVVPTASALTTTHFTDSPVVPAGGSTTFYYVVRAFTGTCLSPYSTPVAVVIPSPGSDAGADAGPDAAADASPDAAADTAADASSDAAADTVAVASPDAAADASRDTAAD